MKKIISSFILALLVLNPFSVFAANTFKTDAREADNFTTKVQEFNGNLQIVVDYDGRTDGQPVYMGYAISGRLTSEDAWIVYHFTYDGDNQLTTRKTAYGVWDDRASLTYQ